MQKRARNATGKYIITLYGSLGFFRDPSRKKKKTPEVIHEGVLLGSAHSGDHALENHTKV